MLKMIIIIPNIIPINPSLSLSFLITAEAPNPIPIKPKNSPKKKKPITQQAIDAIAESCDIPLEVIVQPQSGHAFQSLFKMVPHFGQTLSIGI